MKVVILTVAMLAIVGCSNTPSKLERIEALESENAVQQTQIQENMKNINENEAAIEDTNIKIDRMFEKAQYK